MTGTTRPPAPWREHPLLLECDGERLLAVICQPAEVAIDLGVVIVVGGPQYRAGSHRQFVQLARSLAAAGTPVLRFDARGMGDSTGEQRPFTELTADVSAAIEGLHLASASVSRIVLCGLCDGASAALLHLAQRRRADVAGLILMNPWVRSGAAASSGALVRHYYARRVLDRAFWSRLLRGGLTWGSLREFFGHAMRAARPADSEAADLACGTTPTYPQRMQLALATHPVPVLLVLSGADLTAQEFVAHANADAAWKACLQRPQVQQLHLPTADHTFSNPDDRRAVEAACIAFAKALRGGVPTTP